MIEDDSKIICSIQKRKKKLIQITETCERENRGESAGLNHTLTFRYPPDTFDLPFSTTTIFISFSNRKKNKNKNEHVTHTHKSTRSK